jgi:nucleoside-diphosphate-sugar epimerase
MPVLEKIAQHKNTPLAIIYNGADILGVELAKLLVEQGALVIIIDTYSQEKKRIVSPLLEEDLFHFIDASGTDPFIQSVARVDYIFYFNHKVEDPDEEISTSDFLEKSNTLDLLLKLGVDKGSKFLLTSSIQLHKHLQTRKDISSNIDLNNDGLSYTILEVQRYAENLTWEYHKRSGLNARIVRVGELLGKGVDFNQDSIAVRYIKDAIRGKKIVIEGDGLENLYFIYVLDAAYGLVKAQFSKKTSGEIYSLVIPRDITVLNLAYKILDLEPKAAGIDFEDEKKSTPINIYKPAPSLSTIGWKEKVSFERALAQTIDYAYKVFGKYRKKMKIRASQDKKTLQRENSGGEGKKKRSLKDILINFFFEVKEEEPPKSVLDSAQFKSSKDITYKENFKSDHGSRIHFNSRKEKDSKVRSSKQNVSSKTRKFLSRIKKPLENLSLPTFFGYIVVFIFVFIIYISLFVPLMKVIYFYRIANIKIESAKEAFQSWQFEKSSEDLIQTSNALDQVDRNIRRLSFLSRIDFFKKLEDIQDQVEYAHEGVDGLQLLADIYIPVENHLNNYQMSIQMEGTDNLSSKETHSYDLTGFSDIEDKLNRAKIKIGSLNYIQDDVQLNISYFDQWISDFTTSTRLLLDQANTLYELASVLPTIYAFDEENTIAILLVNPENLNAHGGEIVSICVLTIDNGIVNNIEVYSPDEIDISLTLEQEQLVRSDLKMLFPDEGLSFGNLTMIFEDNIFKDLVRLSINSKFGESPDYIITMNFNALKSLLSYYQDINLSEGIDVNVENFDDEIVKEGISYNEILSKAMIKIFDFNKDSVSSLGTFFSENLPSKDVYIYSDRDILTKFLENKSLIKRKVSGSYDKLEVLLVSESGSISEVNVESKIDIQDKGGNFEYIVLFKPDQNDSLKSIATLSFGPDFEINNIDCKTGGLKLASSYSDRIFLEYNMSEGEEERVIVKGNSNNVLGEEQMLYNFTFRLPKPVGFSYEYDFVVDYGDSYQLESVSQDGIESDSTVRFSGTLQKDIDFSLVFSSTVD